jgi:hypothetical protein
MAGSTHKLILSPGKLELESKRDLLSNKIGRAVGKIIQEDKKKPKKDQGDPRIEVLKTIGLLAKQVQNEAKSQGKDRKAQLHEVPGYVELKRTIEAYADAFNAKDIDATLPEPSASPTVAVDSSTTTPPAPDTRGKIQGVDEWIKFNKKKGEKELKDASGELPEARTLVNENPGKLINVGAESSAPKRPLKPGQKDQESMKGVDIEVKDPTTGKIERSIEVKTLEKPVENVHDLSEGVRHATEKASERKDEGEEIPNAEATVRMSLKVGIKRGGNIREIKDDGTITRARPDTGQIYETTNIFANFATTIAGLPNTNLLKRVTVVDVNTGKRYEYERTGTTWSLK